MGRAIVKSTSNPGTGTTGVGITVGATGATGSTTQGITSPPGQVVTGTLVDSQSGAVVNFSQAFGAELGIVVGAKVEYQTSMIAGQSVANVVKLSHRGVIVSVNSTDDGGVLTDKATETTMPFAQTGAAESGIVAGAKVNFERIIDPTTALVTAVALVVVND